jgi:hypothetical protein
MIDTDTVDRRGGPLAWLLVLYGLASLVHFAHNAEYLESYPNLPGWLSRSQIYGAWCGIIAIGTIGYTLYRRGRVFLGFGLLLLYTSIGFDGLLHYQRAPLAAHTVAMNLTIWVAALALAAVATVVGRDLTRHRVTDASVSQ